jgi:hypothetical protein
MEHILYHKKRFFSSAHIRAHPRLPIKAKFIFLLALVFPAVETKVVIRTEEPGADVYLDGNYVAKTDTRGNLSMESLPPGLFRIMVKKNGCQPYDGSFQITEGESKIVQVQLCRVQAAQSAGILSPVKKPRAEETAFPPESATARQPPEAVPGTQAPPETKAAEDSWPSEILIVSAASAALLWAGLSIVKRRTRRAQMESPQIERIPSDDDPSGIPVSMIKPTPEFVDRLKRREELMEAGFLPVNCAKREKEVVIVLPKEAYTSKEE